MNHKFIYTGIILIILVGCGSSKYKDDTTKGIKSNNQTNNYTDNKPKQPQYNDNNNYTCGTKYLCSEMNSCEEATYYFEGCDIKKLDRDNDGIPCESLCNTY